MKGLEDKESRQCSIVLYREGVFVETLVDFGVGLVQLNSVENQSKDIKVGDMQAGLEIRVLEP